MKFSALFKAAAILLAGLLSGWMGCAGPPPHDYGAYLDHMPRSILVLPPVNESTVVMAPYIYLSTITRPLAERGYYVFPVAVIDAMMKENGLPTPEDMALVPLAKIREVIGPDAVLYVTVVDWGTKYQIIDSHTVVRVRARLVDTDTGLVLWEGEHAVRQSSSSGQNDLVGALVSAVVNQIIQSIVDPTRDVAAATNDQLFDDERDGLLLGERHSRYEVDQQEHRALQDQAHPADGAP
jgi:hypothetical protein